MWVEHEPMVFERRPVELGREQDGRIQIRKVSSLANAWWRAAPSSSTTSGSNETRGALRAASMLRSLIAACLSRRPLVLIAFAAVLGMGYAAFTTLNIEAYPDPAPPIIEIIAQ